MANPTTNVVFTHKYNISVSGTNGGKWSLNITSTSPGGLLKGNAFVTDGIGLFQSDGVTPVPGLPVAITAAIANWFAFQAARQAQDDALMGVIAANLPIPLVS